jgi:hypothetical protein
MNNQDQQSSTAANDGAQPVMKFTPPFNTFDSLASFQRAISGDSQQQPHSTFLPPLPSYQTPFGMAGFPYSNYPYQAGGLSASMDVEQESLNGGKRIGEKRSLVDSAGFHPHPTRSLPPSGLFRSHAALFHPSPTITKAEPVFAPRPGLPTSRRFPNAFDPHAIFRPLGQLPANSNSSSITGSSTSVPGSLDAKSSGVGSSPLGDLSKPLPSNG